MEPSIFKNMNNFNTFFVSSTINVVEFNAPDISYEHNIFTSDQRFNQTLKTIDSIRDKDPNSRIVLIDNSIIKLNSWKISKLENICDIFLEYPHNVFSTYCNSTPYYAKSMGELLLTEMFLKTIKEHNLVGKRIFKLNGRYILGKSFDINFYQNTDFENKYVYKIVPWWFSSPDGTVIYKDFLETKFWSYSGSLVNEYQSLLPKMFEKILVERENLEVSHNEFIPKEKSIFVDMLHIEGSYPNGEYTSA